MVAATAPAQAQSQIVSPIDDVARVAHVIGEAHKIRQLCNPNDQIWREQMLALIDLEAAGDDRRQRRLVEAFNDGFRAQERVHSRCNADARQAEAELADEGRRLAEALRDRYLN